MPAPLPLTTCSTDLALSQAAKPAGWLSLCQPLKPMMLTMPASLDLWTRKSRRVDMGVIAGVFVAIPGALAFEVRRLAVEPTCRYALADRCRVACCYGRACGPGVLAAV